MARLYAELAVALHMPMWQLVQEDDATVATFLELLDARAEG